MKDQIYSVLFISKISNYFQNFSFSKFNRKLVEFWTKNEPTCIFYRNVFLAILKFRACSIHQSDLRRNSRGVLIIRLVDWLIFVTDVEIFLRNHVFKYFNYFCRYNFLDLTFCYCNCKLINHSIKIILILANAF